MGALSWASLIAAQAIFSMVNKGAAIELHISELTLDFSRSVQSLWTCLM
jgi:hypothetical protein